MTTDDYEERRQRAVQERDMVYAEVRTATAYLSIKLKRAAEVELILSEIEREKNNGKDNLQNRG